MYSSVSAVGRSMCASGASSSDKRRQRRIGQVGEERHLLLAHHALALRDLDASASRCGSARAPRRSSSPPRPSPRAPARRCGPPRGRAAPRCARAPRRTAHSTPAPTFSAKRIHESPVKTLKAAASTAISSSVPPVKPKAASTKRASTSPSTPPGAPGSATPRLCRRSASSAALEASTTAKPASAHGERAAVQDLPRLDAAVEAQDAHQRRAPPTTTPRGRRDRASRRRATRRARRRDWRSGAPLPL